MVQRQFRRLVHSAGPPKPTLTIQTVRRCLVQKPGLDFFAGCRAMRKLWTLLFLFSNGAGAAFRLQCRDRGLGGGTFCNREILLTRHEPPARAISRSRPAQNFPASLGW